ncbi:MAG: phosphatidate cytidylyltransferase [Flavobacteriales bacterium]|nr:phosphatidate cytidylyltransferase [Flavobacteriales bacterium]
MILYPTFLLVALILQQKLHIKNKENPAIGWKKFLFFNLIMLSAICLMTLFSPSVILLHAIISVVGFIEICRHSSKLATNQKLWILALMPFIFGTFIYASLVLKQALIIPLVATAIFDGFSQLTGKMFGIKKIVPTISPNKTVAGFAGGLAFCWLFCVLYIQFFNTSSKPNVSLFFIPILAFAGDIFFSKLKRVMHIKDFADSLPGQGGILDRFDSYIFTAIGLLLLHQF